LGDAGSQVLQWTMPSVAKAGAFAIIGAYPQSMRFFPIRQAQPIPGEGLRKTQT